MSNELIKQIEDFLNTPTELNRDTLSEIWSLFYQIADAKFGRTLDDRTKVEIHIGDKRDGHFTTVMIPRSHQPNNDCEFEISAQDYLGKVTRGMVMAKSIIEELTTRLVLLDTTSPNPPEVPAMTIAKQMEEPTWEEIILFSDKYPAAHAAQDYLKRDFKERNKERIDAAIDKFKSIAVTDYDAALEYRLKSGLPRWVFANVVFHYRPK